MRTTVYLDDAAVELLNRYCGQHHIKSAVICMAIKYFFSGGKDDLTDEEIQHGLREVLTKKEERAN